MSAVYRASTLAALIATALSTAALAAPGDIHRVTGADVVNLRAGPSDESNIRGSVHAGDEVIELTRDGNWIGARVLPTGEEGWIYGGLLERVAASGLVPGDPMAWSGRDAGFMQLSESFDHLIRRFNGDLGYRMVDDVVQTGDGVLQVKPTAAWMRSGSRDTHMMGALAFYQLWKNHQNGRPVALVMTDDRGEEYIRIADGDLGPELAMVAP
jgi:uncharacterized protein YgiM (DUF1202 family)